MLTIKKFGSKKALAKQGNAETFHNTSPAVPLLAVFLALAVILGCVRVFWALPEKALASISPEERRSLSVTAMPDGSGTDDVLIPRDASVYGSVHTADGVELFCAVEPYGNIDEAFGSLIGSPNDTDIDDTRYVINNYADSLFPAIQYAPTEGIMDSSTDVTLTLYYSLQEDIYELMKGLNVVGNCYVFNYETGQTKAAVSTPGWGCSGDGAYINRNLYAMTPGSTMKLITTYLLLDQGIDVSKSYTCTGSYKLPNGKAIKCSGVHGSVNGASAALGKSCNCWFAHQIQKLDMYCAKKTLQNLGFAVNDEDTANTKLGKLPCNGCSVTLDGNSWTFSNIWELIGQDAVLINPVQMSVFCAQCATGGNAALPRLTGDEDVSYSAYAHEHAENFSKAYELWQAGYQAHYGSEYSSYISSAKTGTAELGTKDAIQKSLCFVSEELQVAGYINIENFSDCQVMPVEICNRVMHVLASMQ